MKTCRRFKLDQLFFTGYYKKLNPDGESFAVFKIGQVNEHYEFELGIPKSKINNLPKRVKQIISIEKV